MILIRIATVSLALAFSASALAGATGDIAKGKIKAQACTACHGADGSHPTADKMNPPPVIGGQYPDYLAKALHDYKSGKRKNLIMGGQAKDLTEQDIADLTVYFGSLDPQIHDLSGHTR